ncbi:Tat binding protein 1(TBP-1)-interacting protein, putative [Plasmodium malariae]|uniref:Tat binding protein 1(TBP-1)-interacting protein, putative n=1 Tax=Plasmodium malariae TaxID=5858 RepID=A0A1C3KEI1_PLAMA|nr:Tat binding protein 1(TBP-1)-interacting protein, putative [Plasmodium malariae]
MFSPTCSMLFGYKYINIIKKRKYKKNEQKGENGGEKDGINDELKESINVAAKEGISVGAKEGISVGAKECINVEVEEGINVGVEGSNDMVQEQLEDDVHEKKIKQEKHMTKKKQKVCDDKKGKDANVRKNNKKQDYNTNFESINSASNKNNMLLPEIIQNEETCEEKIEHIKVEKGKKEGNVNNYSDKDKKINKANNAKKKVNENKKEKQNVQELDHHANDKKEKVKKKSSNTMRKKDNIKTDDSSLKIESTIYPEQVIKEEADDEIVVEKELDSEKANEKEADHEKVGNEKIEEIVVDEKADDGNADDGNADDGNADDGNADEGNADNENAYDEKQEDKNQDEKKQDDKKQDDKKQDEKKQDEKKQDDEKVDDEEKGRNGKKIKKKMNKNDELNKGKQAKVTLCESEAKEKIFKYMKQTNRPYSVVNVYDNLHGSISKNSVQKLMDELSVENKLQCKEYGKAKVYLINQKEFKSLNMEEINKLKKDIERIKEETEIAKNNYNNFVKKRKKLIQDLELIKNTDKYKKSLQQIEEEINIYEETNRNCKLTVEEIELIKRKHGYLHSTWLKRKNLCIEIIKCIASLTEKDTQGVIYHLGIDVDEDVIPYDLYF